MESTPRLLGKNLRASKMHIFSLRKWDEVQSLKVQGARMSARQTPLASPSTHLQLFSGFNATVREAHLFQRWTRAPETAGREAGSSGPIVVPSPGHSQPASQLPRWVYRAQPQGDASPGCPHSSCPASGNVLVDSVTQQTLLGHLLCAWHRSRQ